MGLVGKWLMESSEKFDDFLKTIGVGFVMRNMAKVQTPTVEISNEGDDWSIKTITTFKTSEIKFKLGQEFDETRLDGVIVKSTITLDGPNKLVQKWSGDPPAEIIREVDGDKLNVTCKAADVVSTRVYKRV